MSYFDDRTDKDVSNPVHGEGDALDWFGEVLKKDLPDTEILIPRPGEPVDLA